MLVAERHFEGVGRLAQQVAPLQRKGAKRREFGDFTLHLYLGELEKLYGGTVFLQAIRDNEGERRRACGTYY
jgi:hypothetical protein